MIKAVRGTIVVSLLTICFTVSGLKYAQADGENVKSPQLTLINEQLRKSADTNDYIILDISYEISGGPPPGNSRKFNVKAISGKLYFVVKTEGVSRDYKHYQVKIFQMPAKLPDVKTLVDYIIETNVLSAEKTSSEKVQQMLVDGALIQFTVAEGSNKITRSYLDQLPASMQPMQEYIEKLLARVESEGSLISISETKIGRPAK